MSHPTEFSDILGGNLNLLFKVILFTFSLSAYAKFNAYSTVHRAPIFSTPDKKSKVLVYLNNGEQIFIHPNVFKDEERQEFYPVINKSGIEGFIHYDHFIVYSTDRPIPKELKVDNTNYLSKKSYSHGNYVPETFGSTQFFLHLTPGVRSTIDYKQEIKSASIGMNVGGSSQLFFPIKMKESKDIFIGATVSGFFQKNDLTSTIGVKYDETIIDFSVGPSSYWEFVRKSWFKVGANLSLPFNVTFLTAEAKFGSITDDRQFYNLSISPRIDMVVTFLRLFSFLDLSMGASLKVNPNIFLYELSSGKQPAFWDLSETQITNPNKIHGSLFVGIRLTK